MMTYLFSAGLQGDYYCKAEYSVTDGDSVGILISTSSTLTIVGKKL